MKLRVLHLEDNLADVELVRSMLAQGGLDCDVLAVNSGASYLAALQQAQFDVILSDSNVPGYDGRAARSAAHEHRPGVPFIVVSADPELADRPGGAEPDGAAACVAKSQLQRLAPTIRRVLPDTTPGQLDAAAAHVRDLERRLAQRTAELERRTRELEVLNRELETFSYAVAHDLRSPLISIDGFSQVLLEGSAAKLDETDRGHLERITLGVRHMHRLINDLLNLSTIVRAPLHAGVVDLGQLAQEILQELRERAPERRVECVIAEGIKVQGDAGLLRLALENLLSNAWKFTGAREQAHITLGARTDDEGRDVYYVRDDGAGFDPQYADKLFSPFQRLHPQTQFPGTGIGLATVQRIIHRHGGEIWAESSVDRGACFYFTLAEMACGHFSERSY